MAILGAYRINFTDPKNGSFVIDPYTVNGTVTPVTNILHNSAVRSSTSLLLPGQYVPNYGESILENLVHLLENFSGSTAPVTPVEGQLWFDTGDSYNIIDVVVGGCVIKGNHSATFSQHITEQTPMTLWYGPKSLSDNSFNSISFNVTALVVNVDGNTQLTVTDLDGNAIQFPNSTNGGFITTSLSALGGRLKVAAKLNNSIVWTDAVNILAAPQAPIGTTFQQGDVWFDTATNELKLNINGGWLAVTTNMLPRTGGTLQGPLFMGTHPISYVGSVLDESTLTNKLYVDHTIDTLLTPVAESSASGLLSLNSRVDTLETQVPLKLNVTGGILTGPLIFGTTGDTTNISHGIDMKNRPIVNTSITWDSADYLAPIGEAHNVVDKSYIGRAIQQHLDDELHGGVQYITEELDGSGLITNNIHFSGATHSISWNANNTIYSLGVNTDSIVFTTGESIGSGFEFRQFGVAGSPLLEITDSRVVSTKSIYILDGQPQPDLNGAIDAINDETAAATKGYVKAAVDTAVSNNAPVIGATFAYDMNTIDYPLTVSRRDDTDIVVNINHEHLSTAIKHDYLPLVNWNGGAEDDVQSMIGGGRNPISAMLNALNVVKAPVRNARFVNAPKTMATDGIMEINGAGNWFTVAKQETTIQAGFKVVITESNSTQTVYTVTSIILVDDGNGGFDEQYVVDSPLPVIADLLATPATATYAIYSPATSVSDLVNRETVDYAIKEAITASVKPQCFTIVCSDDTSAIAAATGVATIRTPFGFTLTGIRASLTTAQASGTVFTVDVKVDGTTILSTLLTIDNTTKSSKTATIPAVISNHTLPDDCEITVDVTQVGNGSAKGLKVYLLGNPT